VGEVLGAAVLAEGRRRAGGGVGETQAESLVGDAVEAVVDESGEPGVGTPGGGVAHRGRLLERDIDAAASGVFDGLLGLVVEVVVLQAVTEMSQGAEMGAGARATQPSDRRTWPRSTRRTMEGSIAWMRELGREDVGAFVSESREVLQSQARNVFGK
jgi:hypothetical protein